MKEQEAAAKLLASLSKNMDTFSRIAANNIERLMSSPLQSRGEGAYHGVTDLREVYAFQNLKVFRYRPDQEARAVPPILLVPSMINRSYIMDLIESSSLAGYLSEKGIPTYLLDWGTPGPQHDHLSFGTFIDDLMQLAVRAVSRDSGQPALSLLGYCMGGTMCILHAAMNPKAIRSVILLAAPVSFHDGGVLSQWARKEVFDVKRLMDVLKHMDPLMLQTSFQFLKPMSAWQKLRTLYENSGNKQFVESFVRLESWLNDNVQVPGQAFREYVEICYHDNRLVNGGLTLNGVPVDLKNLTVPILNVIALKDHIVPPESSRIVSTLTGGPVTEVLMDAGHIGIAMGRKAREMFEKVAAFQEGLSEAEAGM